MLKTDFPALDLADAYATFKKGPTSPSCTEPHASYLSSFHWTERHLQCIWFDGRLRPDTFKLPSGEQVTILDPGSWNLEAGPDFLNASLLLQPGARQVRGDVEIHIRPTDWVNHKHATDPAYQNVIAHVTWFPGPAPAGLPASACSIALMEPIKQHAGFSLDDIDIKAYPHAILPEEARPCQEILSKQPDLAERLLASAGQYRLRLKALRLSEKLEQTGNRQQVFYEEVMAALGYKHNQMAFRILAQRLPFEKLSLCNRQEGLALLLGTAKLLPEPDDAQDPEAQRMIRSLWDVYWRFAGEEEPLPAIPWKMGGTRPQNAPVRRLAAAASLFTGKPDLLSTIDRISYENGLRWWTQAKDCFGSRCAWPFWNQRLSFTTPKNTDQNISLLGDSRISAILTNTLLPMTLAEDRWPEDQVIRRLAPEDLSAPMRKTAWMILGRDYNPALYADNGLLQQGLLQIHLDFCLNARPDCSGCKLLAALQTENAILNHRNR